MIKKIIYKLFIPLFLLSIIAILIANLHINIFSEKYLFDSPLFLPVNKAGIILGTSKYFKKGEYNSFYSNRLQAAVKLYKSGKIKYIIASGDNSDKNYNEPKIMKIDLINSGIPSDSIYLDFAGFRTLDSIIRANKVFGMTSFTIISQKFHNQRAVFIARKFGIHAVGFNANDVDIVEGIKTILREYLAKTKAIIDVYIIKKQPKYLGEKIEIKHN